MQRRAWARPSCSRRWRWWWARRGSGHTIRRCSSRSVGSSCSTVCCTAPGSSRVHWLRLGWSGACFRSPGSHCGPFWGIPPKCVWPCRWLRPTWLWRAGCWSGDSMNDIAPFKPKRMALEPATDPNPDIVFRFFLWLLDFEFLRMMDDNFAVVESGVKAIGPRLFFDRDVGGEMGQTKEPDASNYGMEQLPARLVQFASELCNRVPGDGIVTVKRVISDLTDSLSLRVGWVSEVLHTKEYFDGLSTAKCGYCPDPEYTDTAERPGLLTLSISICRCALRDLFPFGTM